MSASGSGVRASAPARETTQGDSDPPLGDGAIRLIVNGKTDHETLLETLREAARATGAPVQVRVTRGVGDAPRWAEEAARAGARTVVAVGGDGTLNEVVRGVLEAPRYEGSVGVIPAGTANDFATSAGIPDDDPQRAFRLLIERTPVTIDVGRVNDRPFVNVATAGFPSEASARTAAWIKKLLGRMAYLVSSIGHLNELEPSEARVSAPGFEWEGRFYLLAVGNGRTAGGGVELCPDALLNDGELDLALLPAPLGAEELAGWVGEGLAGLEDSIVRRRVPALCVEADRPLQVNVDGEATKASRHRFEVERRVLRFHLPTSTPSIRDPSRT